MGGTVSLYLVQHIQLHSWSALSVTQQIKLDAADGRFYLRNMIPFIDLISRKTACDAAKNMVFLHSCFFEVWINYALYYNFHYSLPDTYCRKYLWRTWKSRKLIRVLIILSRWIYLDICNRVIDLVNSLMARFLNLGSILASMVSLNLRLIYHLCKGSRYPLNKSLGGTQH
jgi:hypothetical protein